MRKCGGIGKFVVGDCFNILGVLGIILLVCFVLWWIFLYCFGGNLCFILPLIYKQFINFLDSTAKI